MSPTPEEIHVVAGIIIDRITYINGLDWMELLRNVSNDRDRLLMGKGRKGLQAKHPRYVWRASADHVRQSCRTSSIPAIKHAIRRDA